MTENLYLILHKVRGEPAFDIAAKLEATPAEEAHGFDDIWIIPTSGHRAYPVCTWPLYELVYAPTGMCLGMTGMPDDLSSVRDHYAASEPRAAPAVKRVSVPSKTQTEDFIV